MVIWMDIDGHIFLWLYLDKVDKKSSRGREKTKVFNEWLGIQFVFLWFRTNLIATHSYNFEVICYWLFELNCYGWDWISR